MISEATLKKLRTLTSDLVLVGMTSANEEWRVIHEKADELSGAFLQDGDSDAQEVAGTIADIAKTLSKGIIANPEAGVKAIQSLSGVLQGLNGGSGIVESHRKQALAEAGLFFRDAKKEEARVKQATTFEDDDEQREMIMAIEQRIDELESALLALCPPVTESDEVRSIFRQFHTLKGEGAICGIKSVADFCHGIESEIEGARSGNLILTNGIVAALQELTAIARQILAGVSREDIGEDLIQSLMDELHTGVVEAQSGGNAGAEEAAAGTEGGEEDQDKFADFFSGFAPPPPGSDLGDSDGEEVGITGDCGSAGDSENTGETPAGDLPETVSEPDGDAHATTASGGNLSDAAAAAVADAMLAESRAPELPSEGISAAEARHLAESLSAAEFLSTVFTENDPDAAPELLLARPSAGPESAKATPESALATWPDPEAAAADHEEPVEEINLSALLADAFSVPAKAPVPVQAATPAAMPAGTPRPRETPPPLQPPAPVRAAPPAPTPTPAPAAKKAATAAGKKSPGEETVIVSGDLANVAVDTDSANGGDTISASGTAILAAERVLASPASGARKDRDKDEKKVDENRVKAISVDVNRLDDLLEIVGEVSLLGSYISNHLQGQESMSLQTTNLLRACSRLQDVASSMRMTSIRPLFMTVRRAAVDAARASRKMIDINMKGIDTQVDRSIVESLSAALIHIIRNAVDHGIEPADVRRRAGKPERGSITISASRTNSDIVIELVDDGKGFDLKAIHDKAVSMGKIAPDAVLTDEEVADLVFLPGLSTAKKITGLSGRGVGMEIVRESIDSLRGRVEIKTAEGNGSTVRMRFPLMVAAMDAMMVRVGKNILVMPVSQVRECFRASKADIGTIKGGGTIVTIRGVILPVLFLGREFGIEADAKAADAGVLVVVETGEMLAAVLVDDTIGSSQVVIRSLEGPLANSELVAGAAILPDGAIGLVIETTKLTERVATTAMKAFNDAGKRQAENSRQIDTVSIGSNQVGIIDFNIMAPGDQDGKARTHVFAINAFKTREFVPITQLRSIPGSPKGFAGMMLLREKTVPVVHMGVVLGLLNEAQRRPEWEQIVLICEFSGKTVGFLVSSVERVSYISWEDIMPPPSTGGLIQLEYIVGTILISKLKGTLGGDKNAKGGELEDASGAGGNGKKAPAKGEKAGETLPAAAAKNAAPLPVKPPAKGKTASVHPEAQVAFVLDFERIVGNVLELYGDMGTELGNVGEAKKDGVRILLVEDSPLIRKQTNKALSKAGITVIEAGDGQEAWEKVEAMRKEADSRKESIFTRVDLILSDIEMPRMDGYTLTYNIKHDPVLRVLPVLLHSSITNDNMISRATEVEADGFIPKCDPKDLAEQLKKYL